MWPSSSSARSQEASPAWRPPEASPSWPGILAVLFLARVQTKCRDGERHQNGTHDQSRKAEHLDATEERDIDENGGRVLIAHELRFDDVVAHNDNRQRAPDQFERRVAGVAGRSEKYADRHPDQQCAD